MPRAIALFHHGWADWEAGYVLAALRESFGFEVQVAGPHAAPVTSIGGVSAVPDLAFADVDPDGLDLLLVIGSERWAEEDNPEVVDLLRRTAAAGKPVGAICAATLAAARAGLLDEVPHTSNRLDVLKQAVPEYRGEALYRDEVGAVTGGRVVTAPGTAPAGFAIAVLRLVAPDQSEAITAYEQMFRAEHG